MDLTKLINLRFDHSQEGWGGGGEGGDTHPEIEGYNTRRPTLIKQNGYQICQCQARGSSGQGSPSPTLAHHKDVGGGNTW